MSFAIACFIVGAFSSVAVKSCDVDNSNLASIFASGATVVVTGTIVVVAATVVVDDDVVVAAIASVDVVIFPCVALVAFAVPMDAAAAVVVVLPAIDGAAVAALTAVVVVLFSDVAFVSSAGTPVDVVTVGDNVVVRCITVVVVNAGTS